MNLNSFFIKIVTKFLFLSLLVYWSYTLLTIARPWIFLDHANFLIHEAGHFIFLFFGQFIYLLGGSLFQCLVPLIIGCYFFYSRQLFSFIFTLFWFGNNVINVSVYIKDARSMTLDIIGDIHDWNWLLQTANLLQQDQLIGNIVFGVGALFVIVSILGGCLVLINETIKLHHVGVKS